jgi:ferric iron reductase protein FhuF
MKMLPFDKGYLESRHRIVLEQDAGHAGNGSIARLDSEAGFAGLLDAFGDAVHSPERKVTGSLFAKRYSSLIAGALYVWLHYRYALDVSLANVGVAVIDGSFSAHLFRSGEWRPSAPDGAEAGRPADEAYLRHLFADNAAPVFGRTVRHTGIPERNLWATLSYLLAYWKEEWLRSAPPGELQERIQDVYRMMMERADPDRFGGKEANPLTSRFGCFDDPLHDGRQVLVRAACCMNYRLPGEDRYCYSCPLISNERRIEKFITAHASPIVKEKAGAAAKS